jgi:hypothetical protein
MPQYSNLKEARGLSSLHHRITDLISRKVVEEPHRFSKLEEVSHLQLLRISLMEEKDLLCMCR